MEKMLPVAKGQCLGVRVRWVAGPSRAAKPRQVDSRWSVAKPIWAEIPLT